MRTIKFRGKSKRDGEWFYGNLFDIDVSGRTHISTTVRGCLDIDPDTVGQFTGMFDKNGREIYEGDIYRFDDPDSINEVTYCIGCGFAGFDFSPAKHDENRLVEIEIIGNVYDNPELLKGGSYEYQA